MPANRRLSARTLTLAATLLLAALAVSCMGDPASPDDGAETLPTETPVPPTPEPAGGACGLLTLADVEELVGAPATQLSATPESCGYAHRDTTIVVTLQPAHAFETNRDAFAGGDDPQPIDGLGATALYFSDTLNGAVLIQSQETIILSGAGDIELARSLAERILSRQ